jgi:ABC-2 type transport system permease protein
MGISSTIKVLYYKGDNLILMRFPVSGGQIFTAKTALLFISQALMTSVILVPLLFSYASVVKVNWSFYPMIFLVDLFMIVIPFLLSNILAIPIMHLTNRIRNRFGVIILMLTVLIAGFFAGYMWIFSGIVDYLNDGSYSIFSPEIVSFFKKFIWYLAPAKYFAFVLVSRQLYVAFPTLIMTTALCYCGNLLVINKLYKKTLLKNVEIEGSAFVRKTKNRVNGKFAALFKKEFIEVFRSVNYSFQYFVLAVAMPLMVYFCSRITVTIGQDRIGKQVAVGVSILVMLIFATIITSFSATTVTREGKNFYHTKVIPVPLHTQLFVKFSMYFVVSFTANILCAAVLIVAGFVSFHIGAWIFGIIEAVTVGLTLRFMRYDIRKPYFNIVGEGELVNSNPNSTQAVLFGFIVSTFLGVIAMLTAYFLTEKYMIMICSAAAGAVVLYCLFAYFIRLKKHYNRIVR